MAKIRVHEIAKELGIPSKEMVDTLQKMGLDVKNHMSTLEDSQASWIKKQLSGSRIEKGAAKPQIEPGTGNEQAPEQRDSTSRSKQNVIPRQIASGTGTAAERHSSPPTISAPHTPQRDNRHENPASLQGSKGQSTGAASRPNQNNQGQRRPFPENVDIDKKNQDNRPFSRPAGSERSAHEGRPAVDNRPFQDRRPSANQRPGFENRKPSGQPGTVPDRRTTGEQQRPAFDRSHQAATSGSR
ncbi:translation initiation factor IF-2 N-terminal domain-containing protein [Syntrophomonas palmitatica]|uniref:translation initiation factor IF-2 N-terminal domain-containing protein n=1 Tax=Syntrophomonas palmitatica TaxID=402877 RepID=UPI000A67A46C